jgi:hypothetical protein
MHFTLLLCILNITLNDKSVYNVVPSILLHFGIGYHPGLIRMNVTP